MEFALTSKIVNLKNDLKPGYYITEIIFGCNVKTLALKQKSQVIYKDFIITGAAELHAVQ